MDLLEGMGFIKIDHDCQRDVNAALGWVHWFLNCLGYQRGKKGIKDNRLREENIHVHDEYVQFMTVMEEDATHHVVYMDESYIHKNYYRHEDSLFEPNN